jgi:D-alanine-D-alanine ligase
LPNAAHVALRDGTFSDEDLDRAAADLGYPCFVKPANLGSSVGVSRATDGPSLRAAVTEALRFDEWVLIEEGIAGREIEVAVLGDLAPEASLPGEIIPGAEFYTYEDKYHDDRAGLHAPASLDPERTEEVRRLAVEAFVACRAEGMARVDFFFEEDGRGFLVNEVNTIPGFTPISMYPKLWDVSGLRYPQLLDRLIALALERHARRMPRRDAARDA